jgi:assimilatory nitrate reductase catalytic subunit
MFRRWKDPAAAFELLKRLSRGRPCDISGIRDYGLLDERGGVQWPFPARDESISDEPADNDTDQAQERRLFADGKFYTPDGRARFVFADPTRMPEPPTAEFPLLLLTGRGTAAQWHTQTRTAKSAVLRKLYPAEPFLEIHPLDARAARIKPHQPVIVESQRGKVKARALVTPTVRRGQVFLPMHYDEVNRLTLAHFDPHSRQPSYKNCAVRVRPVESWD